MNEERWTRNDEQGMMNKKNRKDLQGITRNNKTKRITIKKERWTRADEQGAMNDEKKEQQGPVRKNKEQGKTRNEERWKTYEERWTRNNEKGGSFHEPFFFIIRTTDQPIHLDTKVTLLCNGGVTSDLIQREQETFSEATFCGLPTYRVTGSLLGKVRMSSASFGLRKSCLLPCK